MAWPKAPITSAVFRDSSHKTTQERSRGRRHLWPGGLATAARGRDSLATARATSALPFATAARARPVARRRRAASRARRGARQPAVSRAARFPPSAPPPGSGSAPRTPAMEGHAQRRYTGFKYYAQQKL